MTRPRLLLAAFFVALAATGCRQDQEQQHENLEQQLGLVYPTPVIPADLPRFLTPGPRARALLRDGETRIDLHEYYRDLHLTGWTRAIEAESSGRDHYFKSREDVYMLDALEIGQEAFWLGYKSALDQIESAKNIGDN